MKKFAMLMLCLVLVFALAACAGTDTTPQGSVSDILVPFLLTKSNILDILLLGENTAISLGIAVERELRLLLIASVALTSACVAVSGGIGFVGLVAPHMARRLIGGRHHALMPASMLLGALLLLLADTLGRSAFQPRDIPVGIVISVLSAPYFLFLLRRYF